MVAGVLAGYYGGFLDGLLMRLADIQLAFPSILLAILIAAVLGPSIANVIISLSLTRWVIFGRVARAATLAAKEREFVLAARASGANGARLLLRHIGPATVAPLIVIATVEVGLVIIAEASLSFLGLGDATGSAVVGTNRCQRSRLSQHGLVDFDDAGVSVEFGRAQRRGLWRPLA